MKWSSCWRLWTCESSCRVGRAVILEIVDMWKQVQGLMGGRCCTLETVDNSPQVQIMRGGVTLETEDMWFQLQSLGRGLHWSLWTCDHRFSVWDVTSHRRLWTYDPRFRVWERVTLETGCVTPGTGFWMSHSGDCGYVTAGGVSARVSPWRKCMCDPRYRVWKLG